MRNYVVKVATAKNINGRAVYNYGPSLALKAAEKLVLLEHLATWTKLCRLRRGGPLQSSIINKL